MSNEETKQLKNFRETVPDNQGIYIPISRVKKYLNDLGLNKDITDTIIEVKYAEPHIEHDKKSKTQYKTNQIPIENLAKKYRDTITKCTKIIKEKKEEEEKKDEERKKKGGVVKPKPEAKNQENKSVYSDILSILSKCKVRFSQDSCDPIAALLCAALHALLMHGMGALMNEKKKTLKIHHLLSEGFSLLRYHTIYSDLDPFKKAIANEEQRQLVLRQREEEKKRKRNSDESFVGNVRVKSENKVEVESELDQQVENTDEEPQQNDTVTFNHFVRKICANIVNHMVANKNKPKYREIQFSKEVLDFCSALIIAFTKNMCRLIRGQLNLINQSTVKQRVIFVIIDQMLTYRNVSSDTMEKINAEIDGKISAYKSYVEEHKKRETESQAESKPTEEPKQE